MSSISNRWRKRVLRGDWSIAALLIALSCGDDPASRKDNTPPSDEGDSPAAGNEPRVPTATAGAAAIAAAGAEYSDDPRASDAGSRAVAGAGGGGATYGGDANETGGAAGFAGSAGAGEQPSASETGGFGTGGVSHTGGATAAATTGGSTTTGSCSTMVNKKARLCGLDGVGVQLANTGYCEICSDAGEARWVACMADVTTCTEAEACGCSE
jgi:hypothetical protein